MKKLLFFILTIIFINSAYADDIDITEYMNKENSLLYMSESNGNYIITLTNKDFIINGKKYNLDNELKNDDKLGNCYLRSNYGPTSNIEFECEKSGYEVSAFKIIENYKCSKEKVCKATLSNLTYSDLYDINDNTYTEKNLIKENGKYYISFNGSKYGPYKYVDRYHDSYHIIGNDIYYIADEYIYKNGEKITNKFEVIYSSSVKSESDPIGFSFNLNGKDITIGLGNIIYKKLSGKVDPNSVNGFSETHNVNFYNSICFENDEENNRLPEFCTKNGFKLKYSEYNKYFVSREGVRYGPFDKIYNSVAGNIFAYDKNGKTFVKIILKNNQITTNDTNELNKNSNKKTEISQNQKNLSEAVSKIKAKLTKEQINTVILRINKILETEKDKKKAEKLEMILLLLSL